MQRRTSTRTRRCSSTRSPSRLYLGTGSLDPFLDAALANDAGVFVVALTSNPEGPQVQHATTADGRTVGALVLDAVATRNAGVEGLGSIGAVVGATVDLPTDITAESLDVNGPLLVPGIGAQGGTVDDVRRVFGAAAATSSPRARASCWPPGRTSPRCTRRPPVLWRRSRGWGSAAKGSHERCCRKVPMQENPFTEPSTLPFAFPPFDAIEHDHFRPAFDAGVDEQRAEVEAVATSTEPPTFTNTVEALERSGATLMRMLRVYTNLAASMSTPEMQSLQIDLAPLIAKHRDEILLDSRLFERIAAVHAGREDGLTPEQVRVVERYYLDFVRAGAALPEVDRDRLRGLNVQITP